MKIAFIADGRSEHTIRWVKYFCQEEVLLISPYKCNIIPNVNLIVLPGYFRLSNQNIITQSSERKKIIIFSKIFLIFLKIPLIGYLWSLIKLIDLRKQIKITQIHLNSFKPDIIHALRIQNEGYIAAFASKKPFIISSWGSDFISFAAKSFIHKNLTKKTMRKTAHFMSDCKRDQTLAIKYGLPKKASKHIFPGNGGVNLKIFSSPKVLCKTISILYCRGLSPYSRIDILFLGISLFMKKSGKIPLIKILAPEATHSEYLECAKKNGLNKKNILMSENLQPRELAKIMKNTSIFISPLTSDGVPNSMLEAMACGMIPVMSNLISVREHVTNNVNGFLFDPNSAESLSSELDKAFKALDNTFRYKNIQSIKNFSEYYSCMKQVRTIYNNIFKKNSSL